MKKGFTLIELLAVIIILGLVGLIVIPSITKLIRDSRQDLYENQVRAIEESARKWGIQNTEKLSETVNTYLSLNNLINAGFIEQDEVKDPRDSKRVMNGCVVISYNNQKSKYIYKYSDEVCSSNTLLVHKFLENNPGFGVYELLYGENYFVGEDPNNWLMFSNKLWRVLKDSDEGIKIIFERSCTGTSVETCNGTENGNISEITDIIYNDLYYMIPSNKWNNEPNYMQEALDQWYNSADLNEDYIEPIAWCIGPIGESEGPGDFEALRNSECQPMSDIVSGTGDYEGYTDFESPIGLFRISDILIGSGYYINYMTPYIPESYLHKNYTYLTMTPIADAWSYYENSFFGIDFYEIYGEIRIEIDQIYSFSHELRPIINLKANVIYKSGTGTEANPYIIE